MSEKQVRAAQFDDIRAYVENLKLKKAVVGGIDPESAYQSMQNMYSMFVDVYVAEHKHVTELEKELRDTAGTASGKEKKAADENGRLREAAALLENENSELKKRVEELESDVF